MDVPETYQKKGRMKKPTGCNIHGGASTVGVQILRGFFTFGFRVTWGSKKCVGHRFSSNFQDAEHFLTKKVGPRGKNRMDVGGILSTQHPFLSTRFLPFCWKLISGIYGGRYEAPNPLLWGWETLGGPEKSVWGGNKVFFVPPGPI